MHGLHVVLRVEPRDMNDLCHRLWKTTGRTDNDGDLHRFSHDDQHRDDREERHAVIAGRNGRGSVESGGTVVGVSCAGG